MDVILEWIQEHWNKLSDGWWWVMMDDEGWMMNDDERWMMSDGWWMMMSDRWWLMIHTYTPSTIKHTQHIQVKEESYKNKEENYKDDAWYLYVHAKGCF